MMFETEHPADKLGRLQHGRDEFEAIERHLAEVLIADREARVGRTYHAIVREHVVNGAVEQYVDCVRLPDLEKVLRQLQQGVMIVDTETTGLYPARGDRVVSVAALGVRLGWSFECAGDEADGYVVLKETYGWEVHETGRTLHRRVDPGRPSDPEAERIHGLRDLTGESRFEEIAKDVQHFLEYSTLLAHNAPFDVDFLDCEFMRTGLLSTMYEDIIDTRVISKMLWPNESGSLDALAKRLGVDRGDRDQQHDALEDCRLLARCLPGLAREIQKRLSND
jgi:DNA polymerase III epsilon subunit-like protein